MNNYVTEFLDTNSIYQDGQALTGGAIYCAGCTLMTFTDVKFEQNYARLGGAIAINYQIATQFIETNININSCTFDENKALLNGGAITISENIITENFNLYVKSTIHIQGVIANQNIANYGSVQGYGGFMNIYLESIDLTISGGTFSANSAQQGGAFNIQTLDNNAATICDIIFKENPQFLQQRATNQYGAIVFFQSQVETHFTIEGGDFSQSGLINQGQLFYIEQQNLSLKTQMFISEITTFKDVENENNDGCVFYLIRTDLIEDGSTLYQDISCRRGGVYYLSHSSINVQNAEYKTINALQQGGIVYTDDSDDITYSFNSCTFTEITAQTAALIYDQSSCTTALTKKITNSIISEITARQGNIIGYIDSSGCSYEINNSQFNDLEFSQQVNSIANANSFRILNAHEFKITNSKIKNIESADSNSESFFYSQALQISVILNENIIQCMEQFSETKSISFNTVFNIIEGNSFQSTDNQISNCNFGINGIYKLEQLKVITDERSSYQYNSAQVGSVYYIVGRTDQQTEVTLQDNKYSNNYGGLGGVIAIYDTFGLVMQRNHYQENSGIRGGVIYMNELSTSRLNSTLHMSNNEYIHNSVTDQGGVLWSSHMLLIAQSIDSYFKDNSARAGGIFYCNQVNELKITTSQFFENYAIEGTIMYSISQNSLISLISNEMIGSEFFNNEQSLNQLINHESTKSTTMYFSSQSTKVIAKFNTYTNFQGNTRGGVYWLEGVQFSDDESIYKNNTALLGGAISCTQCSIQTLGCTFEMNMANQGGATYIESDSNYDSRFDTFEKNTGYQRGGVLFVTTRSVFRLRNSKFLQNQANNDATISALKTNEINPFQIDNCMFLNNKANANTISLIEADGFIINSIFTDNQATQYSDNIIVSFSKIEVTNTRFTSTTSEITQSQASKRLVTGAFLYINLSVDIIIKNCIFSFGIAEQGGAIYLNGLSSLYIYGSTFNKNYAFYNGGAIYASSFEKVYIQDSSFDQNVANENGAEFYGLFANNDIELNNVQITNTSPVTSLFCDTIGFKANRLTITNNNGLAEQGGGIRCLNCYVFDLIESTLENLSALQGGAVYLQQRESSKQGAQQPSYSIINTVFRNNTSRMAGALYLNNPEYVNITGSIFENNTVHNKTEFLTTSGNGGGIYYSCDLTYNCKVIMKNGKFINNFAANSGGGIKWDDLEPEFENNEFINNTAFLYGHDIGSFPQKIIEISEEEFEGQINRFFNEQHQSGRSLQESNRPVKKQVQSQQSGGDIPTIMLALSDKYGNIVGNINSATLEVRIDTAFNEDNPESLTYSPIIEGDTLFISSAGVFKVQNIQFTSSPGYEFKLSFQTDGIDASKPSNQEYLQQLGQTSNSIDFPLYIQLRKCEVGESFLNTGKCESCPEGQQYLLEQLTEPGDCKPCPETEAKCFGGSFIGPQPGYSRKNNYTSVFIQCPNPSACLGIQEPNYNPIGDCAEHYQGVLCADCEEGFSRNADYQCNRCPSRTANSFRLFFILLGSIVFACFLIRSTLKGAVEKKNVTSVYFKILLNHIQLIILTASFNFSWPEQVRSFFSISEPVAQVGDQIFSIDCFISEQGETQSQNDEDYFRVYYVKIMMMALLPILLFISCYLVWTIIALKNRDFSTSKNKAVSSIVILLFFVHPNIVQSMFGVFNCFQVDQEQRVWEDLQIVCYQGAHSFWSFAVALPSLIVWGLGIPFFAFMLMTKQRHRLKKLEVKQKFGFLYNGYKKDFYYWEVVIMYRKIMMIVIGVIIKAYGTISQALVVFVLLIIFLVFNLKKKPFFQIALNDLETCSLVTSMVTIYCGVFFVSDFSNRINTEQAYNELILSEGVKLLFFFMILFANLIFFAFWGIKMFIETRSLMTKKMQKIYLCLCVCFNKKQLERDIVKVKIQEENELMREDYIKAFKKIKKLYQSGRLVLNRIALEKIQMYISKDKILELAGQSDQQLDPEKQKKIKKRYGRIYEFNQKMKDLKNNLQKQNDDQETKTVQKHRRKKGELIIDEEVLIDSKEKSIDNQNQGRQQVKK